MSVVIRLARMGGKGKPHHKIVVTDQRRPRDGRFIEQLGFYDPSREPAFMEINAERASYWLSVGAKPSDTVRSLFRQKKIKQPVPAKQG
ncbi:MAG: 30S ribosomal protein S16 [Candidatus Omnitrophica bacterium]|nr:30S ribosomal protein S16 [Candidatus Omnitrophota bacterium]